MMVELVFGPSITSDPLVINADLIAIGLQSGCRCLSSAASPATCGLDIDVPLSKLKESPLAPGGATEARMSWPGAIRSGFRRSPPPARKGPRDENAAVCGDGTLNTSVALAIDAVAPAVAAYALMAARSVSARWTVGTKWKSAFCEFGLVFTRIMPIPPACCTARLLFTRALVPRSQTTIFPATLAGSSTATPGWAALSTAAKQSLT